MRVLFDTSVLISYLRSTSPETSATGAILGAALRGAVTLLAVDDFVDELVRTIDDRPDLAARISASDAGHLLALLRSIGEPVDRIPEPYLEIGRDRDDYFLIAHAAFGGADYLVSWDKDLLDLDGLDELKVVSPAAFLGVLRDAGLL